MAALAMGVNFCVEAIPAWQDAQTASPLYAVRKYFDCVAQKPASATWSAVASCALQGRGAASHKNKIHAPEKKSRSPSLA